MFENIKDRLRRFRYENLIQDPDWRAQTDEEAKARLFKAIELRWGSREIAEALQDDSIDIHQLLKDKEPCFEIGRDQSLKEIYPLALLVNSEDSAISVKNVRTYIFEQVSKHARGSIDTELQILEPLIGNFSDLRTGFDR